MTDRDYSVEVQPASEDIANALQILAALSLGDSDYGEYYELSAEDRNALVARLEGAVRKLDAEKRPPKYVDGLGGQTTP